VEIGKRKLELSNLEKILYPEAGVVKAEVVEYYYKLAPTILTHLKGRPLTLVRFPDGVHGEIFYQKNRPDWAPDWVEFIQLGKEKLKDYIVASEPAVLTWLANLACLEMHQLHCKKNHLEHPDYIVYDLDPPEKGYHFPDLIPIALALKDLLESYGYHVFVKTTGGKGLHLVTPIDPKHDFHTVFEAAQELARLFIKQFPDKTTLHIKKESRKGRVLIDIYRNRPSQSIIAAYSLRGRVDAPVSTPLTWDALKDLKSPNDLTIRNVPSMVNEEGDAWEALPAYAVELHTRRSSKPSAGKKLPISEKRKTPEQLAEYKKKRDFKKTPEPDAYIEPGENTAFVIHRHHASHLHYDLRLEMNDTLKSWAVPRGMPQRPGIKRMAIQTEDHPVEYLNFDGRIPKGQYGGGDMWIYAQGRYEIIKEKKDGYYFNLHSRELSGEYRIYNTKNNEFLLERLDTPQLDYLEEKIDFMLSDMRNSVPDGDYIYEVKWDGIRAMISLDDGNIRILSRNQKDITHLFPELLIPDEAFRATNGLFDGEIVVLDEQGHPDFRKVVSRLHHNNEGKINHAAKRNPVHCYLFDCLYLDGRVLTKEPLRRRQVWLKDSVKPETSYRVSEAIEDGHGLFEAAKQLGLEGIMAKDPNGKYYPGRRSEVWTKVKVRNTVDCLILGYTTGKGDRSKLFGALQIAEYNEGEQIIYRGKVGSGFTEKLMKELMEDLRRLEVVSPPGVDRLQDPKNSTWIQPAMICEVQYASITKNGTYREPVFLRLRPDVEAHVDKMELIT